MLRQLPEQMQAGAAGVETVGLLGRGLALAGLAGSPLQQGGLPNILHTIVTVKCNQPGRIASYCGGRESGTFEF